MALTSIQATIQDSQGNPLTGNITIVLTSSVSDGSTLYVPVVKTIPLVSGAATFTLDATDTFKVPYTFTVNSVDAMGNATPVITFQAVVPTSATAVLFSDLAKAVGLTQNNQDISLSSISRLVYNSSDFWTKLLSSIFVPLGNWSSTTYYKQGALVTYNNSSYLCTSTTNIVGDVPPSANWQLIAAVGVTGTGTGGNNTPYDATAWNNQLDAPSRGAVRNIVQTLATQLQLSNYAPLTSANLTTPTATTASLSDNSTAVATTAFVKLFAAPLASPTFTDNPALTTLPSAGDNSNKLTTTSWVQAITSLLAPLASPAFTGIPITTAPSVSDNTTRIATTAFVNSQIVLTSTAGQYSINLLNGTVILKFGSSVFTTDASGNGTVTYSAAFPTSVLSTVVSNGDVNPSNGVPAVNASTSTVSTLAVRVTNPGGTAYASGTFRLNWLSVGR